MSINYDAFLKMISLYHSIIENDVYYNLQYVLCIGHIIIILRISK